MNIRYPIYEGVYRILTIDPGRQEPSRPYRALDRFGYIA